MSTKDLSRINLDELTTLFEETFEKKVCPFINVESFDVELSKDAGTKKIVANIYIFGTAGSPTIDDFKNGKVKDADKFQVERSDIGTIDFTICLDETILINSNDYMIVYRNV